MTEYVFQYNNAVEREQILQSNKDKHLFKEEIIAEGNFLTFLDEPYEIPIRTVYTEVPAQQLTDMENAILELSTIIGGMM